MKLVLRIPRDDLWVKSYALATFVLYTYLAFRWRNADQDWLLLWPGLVLLSAASVLCNSGMGATLLAAYSAFAAAKLLVVDLLTGLLTFALLGHGPSVTDPDLRVGLAVTCLLGLLHGLGAILLWLWSPR